MEESQPEHDEKRDLADENFPLSQTVQVDLSPAALFGEDFEEEIAITRELLAKHGDEKPSIASNIDTFGEAIPRQVRPIDDAQIATPNPSLEIGQQAAEFDATADGGGRDEPPVQTPLSRRHLSRRHLFRRCRGD